MIQKNRGIHLRNKASPDIEKGVDRLNGLLRLVLFRSKDRKLLNPVLDELLQERPTSILSKIAVPAQIEPNTIRIQSENLLKVTIDDGGQQQFTLGIWRRYIKSQYRLIRRNLSARHSLSPLPHQPLTPLRSDWCDIGTVAQGLLTILCDDFLFLRPLCFEVTALKESPSPRRSHRSSRDERATNEMEWMRIVSPGAHLSTE